MSDGIKHMKIVCISASRVPSTAANSLQVMKACQALSQLGHEVHLLVPRTEDGQRNNELPSFYGLQTSFPVEWLPAQPYLHRYDFAWHAIRWARAHDANITYVWVLQAAVLALMARLPVIIEMHGPPEGTFGPALFRLFLRLSGKKRLLPITQALANSIGQKYHTINNDKGFVVVSPNGVDLERFHDLPDPATARELLGLPAGLTAGYTGHLYAGRGTSLLVELARRFPDVHFLWVGGRPQEVQEWRQHLANEGLANVTLTGFVENSRLPQYQAAADILLMPYEKVITGSGGGNSSAYASPMKMFEYMACKRAIISSDLPVIREVLNASNAVLCPPEDTETWSQAFDALINDNAKRDALARQAWHDVQQYTWLERARKALIDFGE
jgi:glycosyltransferase involved in cell wall biosynthesis